MSQCAECGTRTAQEGSSICFRCKIQGISFGYGGYRREFHETTVAEQRRQVFADAKRQGLEIEPTGGKSRWI